jgi:hypothetical protein
VIVFWLLLAGSTLYSVWRLFLGYPRRTGLVVLASREAAFLDAAGDAIFPPGGAVPQSGRDADIPGYADAFLASLPAHLRLQVRAMFMLFEQATILFPAPRPGGRRRFSALSAEQRVIVLERWSSSSLFVRRLAFTALRAVVTMGYLGHSGVLRELNLAPRAISTPICEADLLYPAVGALPSTITLRASDLTPPSDGTPLEPFGPVHADYADHAGYADSADSTRESS